MTLSRLSRYEEKRVRKHIILTLLASILLIVFLVVVGIPLLVRVSVFFGSTKAGIISAKDTTPPFPPTLDDLPSATNSARIILKGYGETEGTVRVFLNNEEFVKTLIEQDGAFTTDIKLTKGKNYLTATITDSAGNSSGQTNPILIYYLDKGPKLDIAQPEDNAKVSLTELTIQGVTDENATVTINDRFVTVNTDGSFEFPHRLSDGENTLTIIATDMAGNQTKVERKVTKS